MEKYISLHPDSQSDKLMDVDELDRVMGKLVESWNKIVRLHRENKASLGKVLNGVRP